MRLDEHHRKRRLQQRQTVGPADSLHPTQAVRVLHSNVHSTESLPTPLAGAAGQPFPSEGQSLEHVITLLERLLKRETSQRSRPLRSGNGSRTRSRGPCVLCGSDEHDTVSHCRSE